MYIRKNNDSLRSQIANFDQSLSTYDEHNKVAAMQLDKCLVEISRVHGEKKKLEDENAALRSEVAVLQKSVQELHEDNNTKMAALYKMEMTLSEVNASRDELRCESRQVLSNIRTWLQEQRQINDSLTEKIQEKCVLLSDMKNERLCMVEKIRALQAENDALMSERARFCPCAPTNKQIPLGFQTYKDQTIVDGRTTGSVSTSTESSGNPSRSPIRQNQFENEACRSKCSSGIPRRLKKGSQSPTSPCGKADCTEPVRQGRRMSSRLIAPMRLRRSCPPPPIIREPTSPTDSHHHCPPDTSCAPGVCDSRKTTKTRCKSANILPVERKRMSVRYEPSKPPTPPSIRKVDSTTGSTSSKSVIQCNCDQ